MERIPPGVLDARVEAFLKASNVFETKERSQLREDVLSYLESLCRTSYEECARAKGVSEDFVRNSGVRLFPFGSYRLGVHDPDADIDSLIVAPRFVDRNDFFDAFLRHIEADSKARDVLAVRAATVPVIKMVYDGIEIDLAYAALDMDVVDASFDVLAVDALRNIDQTTVRSLNGRRVNDKILQVVGADLPAFRLALRVVKIWTKARGLYSNKTGFLGGVNLAIMVAYCVTRHRGAGPWLLVERFFQTFASWKWPHPVMLCDVESVPGLDYQQFSLDGSALMPVITPSFPCNNSTYSTSETTKDILVSELRRGYRRAFCVARGRMVRARADAAAHHTTAPQGIEGLVEPMQFFRRYRRFLQVAVSAQTERKQKEWAGICSARLRRLVTELESLYDIGVDVRPWVQEFPDPRPPSQPYRMVMFIGVRVDRARAKQTQIHFTTPVERFCSELGNWEHREHGMEIEVRLVRRADLPDVVFGPDGRPDSPAPETGTDGGVDVAQDAAEGEEAAKRRRTPADA